MGSTVLTNKLASAIRDNEGNILYGLYEEVYCKKSLPATSYWTCRMFGHIEQVMEYIFASASCAYTGLLQSKARSLSATSLISSWLKELAAPVEQEDLTLNLFVRHPWNAPISIRKFEEHKASLIAQGFNAEVTTLSEGKNLELKLTRDAQLIAQLYKYKGMCGSPAISRIPLENDRNAGLGYSPMKSNVFDLPNVEYRTCTDFYAKRIRKGADNVWRYELGNDMEAFIEGSWEFELEHPGSFGKRFKAFQACVDAAKPIKGSELTIIVDKALVTTPSSMSDLENAMKQAPYTEEGSKLLFSGEMAADVQWGIQHLAHATIIKLNTENEAPVQLGLLA